MEEKAKLFLDLQKVIIRKFGNNFDILDIFDIFEIFVIFEVWVCMRLSVEHRRIFLERIDGHETDTIRKIRACSI